MNYKKIEPGSLDKVRGKIIKYKKGDCFSINCNNGKYLAAFISDKFNKYYDLTLIEYYNNSEPNLEDFLNSKFFGNYIRTQNNSIIGVNKAMIPCKYVDETSQFKIIGSINLLDNIVMGSYLGIKDIDSLLEYYIDWLPMFIKKSANTGTYPNEVGDRLIDIKNILQ